MADNKIKIDSVTIENWNYYLKLHNVDDYRILEMKKFEQELQRHMEEYKERMRPVYEVYAIISPHYIATEGPTTKRIIELPKYRAIALDEISKWIVYQGGDRVIWKNPIDDIMHEKICGRLVEVGQEVFENFLSETFYQYAVTKAVSLGQSLENKEKLLKRQVRHNQRVGKNAPLKKYNMVKRTRAIATKQGGYVTKFLDFYNKPYVAWPLAMWTNIFSANGVHYPEENDFREIIRDLLSKHLNRTLPAVSRFPGLDKKSEGIDSSQKK
jgi:hypothetical protein